MNFIAKTSWMKIAYFLLLIICTTSACKHINLYEKNTPIPNLQWQSNFSINGSFNITDTLANYNIYVVLRHTDAYKYNNIWLNVGLQQPGDSMNVQKLNILLGNDAQGWMGAGMNDIWEIRERIATIMLRKGTYNFNLSQIMRDNPLQNIMSAGLSIEKIQ